MNINKQYTISAIILCLSGCNKPPPPTGDYHFRPVSSSQVQLTDDDIYINLFIDNVADIDLNGKQVQITQRTNYPWDGEVNVMIHPEKQTRFKLHIRQPGWTMNETGIIDINLIPYHLWNNRRSGEMRVWIPISCDK